MHFYHLLSNFVFYFHHLNIAKNLGSMVTKFIEFNKGIDQWSIWFGINYLKNLLKLVLKLNLKEYKGFRHLWDVNHELEAKKLGQICMLIRMSWMNVVGRAWFWSHPSLCPMNPFPTTMIKEKERREILLSFNQFSKMLLSFADDSIFKNNSSH